MRFAMLLFSALHALGQVTVAIKPVSLSSTQDAIGSGRIGLWTVSLSSRYAVPVDVPFERISQSFPLLRDIPNRLAEDLLTRQSSNSFWSVAARWGPPLLAAAGAAYAAHGIAVGKNGQAWIGQGIALAPLLVGRAAQRAPEPSVYFSDFCPEHIILAAYGAGRCYLASSLIKGAGTMNTLIDMPWVKPSEVQ